LTLGIQAYAPAQQNLLLTLTLAATMGAFTVTQQAMSKTLVNATQKETSFL